MPYFLIFDALMIAMLALASRIGFINPARVGQVLLGLAVINFVLALLGYFGWPVLRGDVSDQSPLNPQDFAEDQVNPVGAKKERPSRTFVLGLTSLGIIALIVRSFLDRF